MPAVVALACLAAVSLLSAGSRVLPAELAGWQQATWVQVDARELERVAPAEAAVLREYGAVGAEQAEYRRGPGRFVVTIFRMQDHTGAYGAQSLLRGNGAALDLGEAGARTLDGYVFYQGNYLVLAGPGAEVEPSRVLAGHLAELRERVASLPTLGSFLPAQGLQKGSEQYFLGPRGLSRVFEPAPGDWVGFAYGAEVQLARYRLGNQEGILLLISYPTPQIARGRLAEFERTFNLNRAGEPDRPAVFARRMGTLVAFVSGFSSSEPSEQIFSGIHYGTELSWSDPSALRPQPNWVHTLLNIFVGTGLLLLFTLASGLAYGLLRLAVTRFFPGLIFDRPSDSDMIILKLEAPPHK